MSYNGSLDFLNMIKNSQKQESDADTQNKTKKSVGQKTVAELSRKGQPRVEHPGTEASREAKPRGTQPREAQPREAQPRGTQPRGTQPREAQSREAQSRGESSIREQQNVDQSTENTEITERYAPERIKTTENAPRTEKQTTKPQVTDLTIAVIDTETNWRDEVMSLGVALADAVSYKCLEKRYYIFEPECMVGGMFSNVMYIRDASAIRCRRYEAVEDLEQYLVSNNVSKIFAYNARFDYGHLPELQNFEWFDIMRIAAYKQYNRAIPDFRPCCKTGRLKSDYGVQSITRLLAGDNSYSETHNAVFDAMDELKIMELMGVPLYEYEIARIT